MNSVGLENEKKFLKLVNLYQTNRGDFDKYIDKIQTKLPSYARFPEGIRDSLIHAIEGYLSYNEFMNDYVQYIPEPDIIIGRSGGKKRTYKIKKYHSKKSRKHGFK
jgi:hypothetical protein